MDTLENRITILNKKDVKMLGQVGDSSFGDNYYVTSDGNVYKKIHRDSNMSKQIVCRKVLPFKTRDGYIEYVLTDTNGKQKHVQGQRIVALTYLFKPDGSDYVNHIDGNRSNNSVSNLEWVTQSENIQHSYDKLGKVPWNKGRSSKENSAIKK
jgi:hypothetical protein